MNTNGNGDVPWQSEHGRRPRHGPYVCTRRRRALNRFVCVCARAFVKTCAVVPRVNDVFFVVVVHALYPKWRYALPCYRASARCGPIVEGVSVCASDDRVAAGCSGRRGDGCTRIKCRPWARIVSAFFANSFAAVGCVTHGLFFRWLTGGMPTQRKHEKDKTNWQRIVLFEFACCVMRNGLCTMAAKRITRENNIKRCPLCAGRVPAGVGVDCCACFFLYQFCIVPASSISLCVSTLLWACSCAHNHLLCRSFYCSLPCGPRKFTLHIRTDT